MRWTMPGAEASADAGERPAAVVEQGVDQRSRRRARRRMHDEPGGLVDDDEIVVLVDDFKGDRLGRRVDRRRRGQGDDDLGAGREPQARIVERRAVGGGDRALEDQRLQPRAAEGEALWHRGGQGLIKALARLSQA